MGLNLTSYTVNLMQSCVSNHRNPFSSRFLQFVTWNLIFEAPDNLKDEQIFQLFGAIVAKIDVK